MAKRRDARSVDQASISAREAVHVVFDREAVHVAFDREAVHVAFDYVTTITGHRPTQVTGVAPSDGQGWIVEVEVMEDRGIPPSADMLALYAIELDVDRELLAYHRTHRYMRGNALSPVVRMSGGP